MNHLDQSLSYSQQQLAREPSRYCEGCGWPFRPGRDTQIMCQSCGTESYSGAQRVYRPNYCD